MAERIRLERVKGYRKPAGAVVVARPSKWGNPFPIDGDWITWTGLALGYRGDAAGRRAASVALYRAWLTGGPVTPGPLAGSTEGGALEFTDGSSATMSEHIMGIARFASVVAADSPVIPVERPSLDELRGRDLGCWCRLDVACHADVLLDLANG